MFALRRSVVALGHQVGRRGLSDAGGHGHSQHKKYEGIEAVVRKYLPEDYQIVLATLGGYAGLYALYKVTRKSPAPLSLEQEAGAGRNEAARSGAAGGAGGIPSIFSEKFQKWSEQKGNMELWEKSIEKWGQEMSNPAFAAAYTKSLP